MLTPSRAITGTGSLSCTCSRYGDYMSMQVRPKQHVGGVDFRPLSGRAYSFRRNPTCVFAG